MIGAQTEWDQSPFGSDLNPWAAEKVCSAYDDFSRAATAHVWEPPHEPQFVAPDGLTAQSDSACENVPMQNREDGDVYVSLDELLLHDGLKSGSRRQARRKQDQDVLRDVSRAEHEIASLPRRSNRGISKVTSSRADVDRQRNVKRPNRRGW
jgi:hypothetical protein